MSDGRKRSEFLLRNLMSNVGWTWDEMLAFLLEWNQKNKPPLPENYLRGHITWHKNQKTKTPPPNCDRKEYYQELGLCKGGECEGIRNPLPYTLKKYRRYLFAKKEEERRQELEARKKKQATKNKEARENKETPEDDNKKSTGTEKTEG